MFLDIAKIDFTCPNCGKIYSDTNDIYLNRINRNQSWITKLKCSCGYKFGMTYDYKGNAVSFRIRLFEKHWCKIDLSKENTFNKLC